MSNINEKLSALYDGELNQNELDELLQEVENDPKLLKHFSAYSLISMATVENQKRNIIPFKKPKKLLDKFNSSKLWISNSATAAASIMLTLAIVNNSDLSRMDISTDASNKINSAINSKEAKDIAKRSDIFITDHIMKVINDPNFMSDSDNIDLQNVGFKRDASERLSYSSSNEKFQLRIENNIFGLTNIKYWKHENKMIYLVPLSNGKIMTLYGNISLNSAVRIAKSINK